MDACNPEMVILVIIKTNTNTQPRNRVVQHIAHGRITQASPITLCLSLAVILMDDWRQLCWENQQTRPASVLSLPGSPRSNNKVAYFSGITLATTAAKTELAVGQGCVLIRTLHNQGFNQISYGFRI